MEAIEKHARGRGRARQTAGRRRRMPRTLHLACTVARVGVLGFALAGCGSSLLSVGAPPGYCHRSRNRRGRPSNSSNCPSTQREHSASWPPMAAPTRMPGSKPCSTNGGQARRRIRAADMRYRTILNSPAVNAFALPSGQLYVTRGLIALANDTSGSPRCFPRNVARDRTPCRHPRRPGAPGGAGEPRRAGRAERSGDRSPRTRRQGLLASFSAPEFEADAIGVELQPGPATIPVSAVRFLTSLGHNAG